MSLSWIFLLPVETTLNNDQDHSSPSPSPPYLLLLLTTLTYFELIPSTVLYRDTCPEFVSLLMTSRSVSGRWTPYSWTYRWKWLSERKRKSRVRDRAQGPCSPGSLECTEQEWTERIQTPQRVLSRKRRRGLVTDGRGVGWWDWSSGAFPRSSSLSCHEPQKRSSIVTDDKYS